MPTFPPISPLCCFLTTERPGLPGGRHRGGGTAGLTEPAPGKGPAAAAPPGMAAPPLRPRGAAVCASAAVMEIASMRRAPTSGPGSEQLRGFAGRWGEGGTGLSLRQKEEEEEGRLSARPPHTPQTHRFPQGARTAQAAAQRSSPLPGPLRPAAAAAEDGGEGGGGDDEGGGGGGYGQRRGPASRRRRPLPSAPAAILSPPQGRGRAGTPGLPGGEMASA